MNSEKDLDDFNCFGEPNYLFEDNSYPFQFDIQPATFTNSNAASIFSSEEPCHFVPSTSHSSQALNNNNIDNNGDIQMDLNYHEDVSTSQLSSNQISKGLSTDLHFQCPLTSISETNEIKKENYNSAGPQTKKKSSPKISPKQTQLGTRQNVKEKALQRKLEVQKRMNIEINSEEQSDEIGDKKQQQKIKNRISAQKSRDYKKIQLNNLNVHVEELSKRIKQLIIEKDDLKQKLDQNICVKCGSSILNPPANFQAEGNDNNYQFVRYSNQIQNGIFSSQTSLLAIFGVILCVGIFLNASILPNEQKNAIGKMNAVVLKEFGNKNRNWEYSLDHDLTKDDKNIGQVNQWGNQTTVLSKLMSVYGFNHDEFNYGTQIIDTRVNNQFALETYPQEIDNQSNNCALEKSFSNQSPEKRQRDQIFCTDATIILSELENKSSSQLPMIDLVYSTKHAKSFIQFGDQHFQTQPDDLDRYVHLTCQVVNYYSSELPPSIQN